MELVRGGYEVCSGGTRDPQTLQEFRLYESPLQGQVAAHQLRQGRSAL